MFSLYKPVKRHVTPWRWVRFWPKGHNFNKLGRGLLGDATYKISRLYIQFVTPGQAHFGQRGII